MSFKTLVRKVQRQNHASEIDAQRLIGKIARRGGGRTPETEKVIESTPDKKNAHNMSVDATTQSS